jgi:hypothetical protein
MLTSKDTILLLLKPRSASFAKLTPAAKPKLESRIFLYKTETYFENFGITAKSFERGKWNRSLSSFAQNEGARAEICNE